MIVNFKRIQDPICEITGKEADIRCECMTCQEFRESAKPKTPITKTLYAIAYEYHDPKKCAACQGYRGECWWASELEYTHANDAEEARGTFLNAEMGSPVFRTIAKLMIAPVVGFKVEDKQGKHLSV